MTNKEKLIRDISTKVNLGYGFVEQVFEIVNKRDWAIFCSQMGDYDHPGERVAANKTFEEEMLKLCMTDSLNSDTVVLKARTADLISKSQFYHDKFHTMNEEYVA